MNEIFSAKRLEDEYRARRQVVQLTRLKDIQTDVARDLLAKKLAELSMEASAIGGFLAEAFCDEITAVLHVLSTRSEKQSLQLSNSQ